MAPTVEPVEAGRRSSRRAHSEAGAANFAFVLVFPLVLLMVMGLIQWGLWYHAQSVVDAAAQDGGQVARDATGTPEDGQAIADALLEGAAGSGLLTDVQVEITETEGIVTATVAGRVRSLVPLLGMDLRVEGRSVGPKEQFIPEDQR